MFTKFKGFREYNYIVSRASCRDYVGRDVNFNKWRFNLQASIDLDPALNLRPPFASGFDSVNRAGPAEEREKSGAGARAEDFLHLAE